MSIVSAHRLKDVCVRLLQKVDVDAREASIVSDSLVEANLRGVDSHGVVLLPSYIRKIQEGTMRPSAEPSVVCETPSTILLEGNYGLGPVVATRAMELAIKKAKQTGIGAVSVRKTNYFGMAAYYAMIALNYDMVGIVMCNVNPRIAPSGGRTRILGTNPICFAIPAGEEKPIVFDMATSVVGFLRIFSAKILGKEIPLGWAVDEMGRPTSDPEEALKGALLPFGGYKGYGLSLMIDILTGVLAGAPCDGEVTCAILEPREYANIAQFFLSINVESFISTGVFKKKVDQLIKTIKSAPLAEGFKEIRIPGERAHHTKEMRLKEGIPIPTEVWKKILSFASELGLKTNTLTETSS